MRHAAMPLQLIVHELLPRRGYDASRNAVFQAMLFWGAEADERNGQDGGVELGDALEVRPAKCSEHLVAKVEITLFGGSDSIGNVSGGIEFNNDLIAREGVVRLANRLAVQAAALGDAPQSSDVWTLAFAPYEEAHQVLWRFNDSSLVSASHACIHDIVHAQAMRTPNTTALDWQGNVMTYTQLAAAVRSIVSELWEQSVAPDVMIALGLQRSLEQIVGVVGVLSSGCAYLPLDLKWPAERRHFMMDDAACVQLVTASTLLREFAWFVGTVLFLADVRNSPSSTASITLHHTTNPHHLAYAMYTSGSTGKPKGVMVPHIGVVNLLLCARQRYPSNAVTRFGVPTPYVFDVSVYNIFSSLVVHCGTCQLLQDGSALVTLSVDGATTRVAAVPSILAIARLPPSIEDVEVGGEALTQKAVDNVPMNISMYNYYGPTEVAIWATRREVDRDSLSRRLSSIGRPLPNVYCLIVDPESDLRLLQHRPIGVYGELWLGGVQVARGYLNRPYKTAEVFVSSPCPQCETWGCGIVYRTGDSARWYADGEIEFAGRIDFQVKLRGQRIELGEIEHALNLQKGVIEVVVLLHTGTGDSLLVAYVHPASSRMLARTHATSTKRNRNRFPDCCFLWQVLPTNLLCIHTSRFSISVF